MKHYSLKPIHVVLRSSRLLTLVLAAAAVGTCGLLAVLPIPLWIRLLLATSILLAALYHIARDALRLLPWSVTALEVDAAGRLRGLRRDGNRFDAAVLGYSYVTPRLTVLNVRPAEKRRSLAVLLLPDAVEAEPYRRLRIWLKWGRNQ